MATQTIEMEALTGETSTTMRAFQVGSDTEQANQSATEATNRKGCYTAAFTDLPAAVYRFQLDDSTGEPLAVQYQNVTLETATFQAYESYSAGGGASAAEVADAVWDEAANDHKTGSTFGHWVNIIKKSVFNVEGEVGSGGTPTTTTFRSNVVNDNNAYNDQLLLFTSGNLTGEARPIESYTQTNGVIVVQQAFTQAPAATDEFVILPDHEYSLAEIADEIEALGSRIEVISPLKSNNGETEVELLYGQQYDDAGNAATLFGSVTFSIPSTTQDLSTATGGEFKVYSTTGTAVLSLTSVSYSDAGTANQKVKVALSASDAELATNEFYTYTLTSTYASGSPAQISRGKLTFVSVVPQQ